ncbi:MAG: aminopeptidase P family protein [Lachnospiraceae bacterium]|nr:aminopeptidase P family protein [Lachnospiraceae bacterium]
MDNFFEKNRKKLGNIMSEGSAAVVMAGSAPYKRGDEKYSFSPDRNFYYLTGIDSENHVLFITKASGKISETLYIERDNGYLAKWIGANITAEEASDISGITNIKYIDELSNDVAAFVFKNDIADIYIDLEKREWDNSESEALLFCNEFFRKFPYVKVKNLYRIMSGFRTIKEDYEIDRMRKALDATCDGFYAMMANARNCKKEYEIEAYFDFELTRRGIREKAFKTIVASGKNATILHYSKNNADIGKDDLILVDAGAQFEYYNGDITRTFPARGKFTKLQKKIYNIVLEGQLKVIKAIKPGIMYNSLNELILEYYFLELKKIGLIEEKEDVLKYFFHNIGHFLGAETHDPGSYGDCALKEGMVLTVEPGLYIEEYGIGIRIEDNVLVTKDGSEVLSKKLIKTVEEIEAFMAGKG